MMLMGDAEDPIHRKKEQDQVVKSVFLYGAVIVEQRESYCTNLLQGAAVAGEIHAE